MVRADAEREETTENSRFPNGIRRTGHQRRGRILPRPSYSTGTKAPEGRGPESATVTLSLADQRSVVRTAKSSRGVGEPSTGAEVIRDHRNSPMSPLSRNTKDAIIHSGDSRRWGRWRASVRGRRSSFSPIRDDDCHLTIRSPDRALWKSASPRRPSRPSSVEGRRGPVVGRQEAAVARH